MKRNEPGCLQTDPKLAAAARSGIMVLPWSWHDLIHQYAPTTWRVYQNKSGVGACMHTHSESRCSCGG